MTDHHCDEVLAELDLYLDGELDEARLAGIEEHLRQCSPCLEAFDFEAELRKVIAARCRERASDELRARILSAIASCDADEPTVADGTDE